MARARVAARLGAFRRHSQISSMCMSYGSRPRHNLFWPPNVLEASSRESRVAELGTLEIYASMRRYHPCEAAMLNTIRSLLKAIGAHVISFLGPSSLWLNSAHSGFVSAHLVARNRMVALKPFRTRLYYKCRTPFIPSSLWIFKCLSSSVISLSTLLS